MADKALDAAAAMADVSKLSKFDGKDVVRTTIAVTKAGDGLSDALAIDPQEFHHGDRVVVVLDCEVEKITMRPLKDAPNLLIREHVLAAGTSTIIDADLVASVLAEQAAKIKAARDKAEVEARREKGEYTLDDQALLAEHEDGQHTDLREGCPECDKERAAADAEKASAADAALPEPTPIAGRRRTRKKAATGKADAKPKP